MIVLKKSEVESNFNQYQESEYLQGDTQRLWERGYFEEEEIR